MAHVLSPMLLLAWVIAIRRVPAAIELRFFATIVTPLLLLGLFKHSNAIDFALLAHFIDHAYPLLVHAVSQLIQQSIVVCLHFQELLAMRNSHMLIF